MIETSVLTIIIAVVVVFLSANGISKADPLSFAVAAVIGVTGFFVLLPLNTRILAEEKVTKVIITTNPAGSFALKTYQQCLNPGLFQSNPEAFCKQMVIDLATKQQGPNFASLASSAVDTYVVDVQKYMNGEKKDALLSAIDNGTNRVQERK